jgi:hypothetical protein
MVLAGELLAEMAGEGRTGGEEQVFTGKSQ